MFGGISLIIASCVLFALLLLLLWVLHTGTKSARSLPPRKTRQRLSLAGLAFCSLSIASLLALCLSWFSPGVSQRLGDTSVRILSGVGFWSAIIGFIVGAVGIGRRRIAASGVSLLALGCWLFLSFSAAMSTSSTALARHPIKYLVPSGYVGWITILYGESGAPRLPLRGGNLICKIPNGALLRTSATLENGWAKDEFFYYSADGSLQPLRETTWGGGGQVWDGSVSTVMSDHSKPQRWEETYFIGSEDQFHHAGPQPLPGPTVK